MIYLLFGENAYTKQRAMAKLIETASKNHGEQAVERFNGEELEPKRLAEVLQGASLFSPEKLVIISHASKNKSLWAELEGWIEKLPEGTDVLLVEAAPDRRTKTFKLLQKHAEVKEYQALREAEAANWLVSEAKARGGRLTLVQAEHIVARAATDQWRLSNELNKLLVHSEITEQTIRELIEQTPQANVFALLDAVLHKKTGAVETLLASAKITEDPYMLFGLLSAQLMQLAALVHGKGRPTDDIAKALGTHPFPLRKLAPLAKQVSSEELRSIVETTAALDNQLKSTGLDPWLLLEQTLTKIATR